MKNILTLFIVLWATCSLSAQNIIAYEYWFDDDTTNKTFANVTPSPYYEFNQNVNVSALNDGLHKFNIRFLDDSSRYSSVVSSFFQVLPTTTTTIDTANRKIVETIYWTDDDYGNRVVTPNTAADFVSFMANIDVSALNDGLHKYNFRAKDNAGQYSSVISSFFQKLPNNIVVIDTANRKIIGAEYWFNDDYGNKTVVNVPPTDFFDFMANLDVSTLNDGLHKIHVRTKDDTGQWSSVVSSFFQKLPTALNSIDTADRKIVETIYWIDEDYANRVVTPNTAADFVDFMANIDVSALNDGLHKYNFRAKDDAGQYSSVVSSFFQKLPNNLVVLDTANRKIIGAEYWFNNDYGNKIVVTVSPTDFFDFMSNIDVSALPNGLHKIHIRTKDDAGQWSSVVSSFFQKLPSTLTQPTITDNKIVRYRYTTDGNTQNFITVNLPTPQKYYDLLDSLPLPYLSLGQHSLQIQFQDSLGQWSSVVSANFNVIGCLPYSAQTPTGDQNICQGTASSTYNIPTITNAVSYNWTISPTTAGTITNNGTSATVTWNAAFSGTATLTANGINPCGSGGTASLSVQMNALPTVSLTGNNGFCAGNSTTLTANFSGGNPYNFTYTDGTNSYNTTATGNSYDITVNTAGTYQITSVTTNVGCVNTTGSNVKTITQQLKPTANTTGTTTICNGETTNITFTFTGTAPFNFTYSNGTTSANLIATTATKTIAVSQGGTYEVTALSDANCAATNFGSSAVVTVSPTVNAAIAASGNTTFCNGNSVNLTASGGVSYLWSTGETTAMITAITSDNYSVTVTDANNCTASASQNVTVNPTYATTENVQICTGGTYRGESTSGTYVYNFTSVNGCDSTITVNLLILNSVNVTLDETICQGDFYTVGMNNYSTLGTYVNTLQGVSGCDSVVTLNLMVADTFLVNLTESICQGESYTVGNQTFNSTGIYTVNLTSQDGCDSTIILNLNVKPTYAITLNESICDNQTYNFDNQNLNISGVYVDTLTAFNGCDSVVTLNLIVNPTQSTTLNETICQGQSYTVGNTTYTTSGTYTNTLQTWQGCDSVVTLNLNVTPPITNNLTATICSNENYLIGNTAFNTSGIHTVTLSTSAGCDSVVTVDLTVLPISNTTIDTTICQGNLVTIGNTTYSQSGNFSKTLMNYNNCDSIVNLNLTVLPNATTNISNTICQGQSVTIGTQTFTSSVNNYPVVLQAANGCDSTVYLTLNVLPNANITASANNICLGDSVILTAQNGTNYNWATGQTSAQITVTPTVTGIQTYAVTVTNSLGCTSSDQITINVLNATPPSLVTLMFPANGDSIEQPGTLSWNVPPNTSAFNVYLYPSGTTPPTSPTFANVTTNSVIVSGLPEDIYDWYVESVNPCFSTIGATQTVKILSMPDLTVGNVNFNVLGSNQVFITWFVNNLGGSGTGGVSWSDSIYISLDSTFNGNAILLGGTGFNPSTGGGIGGGYGQGGTFTIPTGFLGSNFYIHVVANANNNLVEINTNNNIGNGTNPVVTPPVVVVPPSLDVISICEGESVNLQAVGGNSGYQWSPATGLSATNTQVVTASPTVSTTFTVNSLDNFGNIIYDTIRIEVNQNPILTTSGDVTICKNENTTLTVSGANNYEWLNPTGLNTNSGSSVTASPISTTQYLIKGTVASTGCFSTANVQVEVLQRTTLDLLSVDTTICFGTSTPLLATSNFDVIWLPNTNLDNDSIFNPIASPIDTTIYTVYSLNTNNNVCMDSAAVTVNVFEVPMISISNDTTICNGESVQLQVLGGISYEWLNTTSLDNTIITNPLATPTATENYIVKITDSNGCNFSDSVIITVNSTQQTIIDTIICSNENFVAANVSHNLTGIYTYILQTWQGCDSTVTLNLIVNPTQTTALNEVICQGQSHTVGTSVYTISGNYTDVLQTWQGCDSTVTLNLIVNPTQTTALNEVICQGQSFPVGTSVYTISGNYTDVLQTWQGCDSTVTLNLIVNPTQTTTLNEVICQGQSYPVGTSVYTISGNYTDVLQTWQGCDSTVTLNLIVNPTQTTTLNEVICQGQSFPVGTSVYTISGNYTDVLQTWQGCDSTVTLNLIVNPTQTTTLNEVICQGQSFPVGTSVYTTSGTYTDVLQTWQGCDSTVTLNLIVNPTQTTTLNEIICQGQSHTVGTSVYTISGNYTDVLQTWQGCDSTVILNLIVNPTQTQTISISICDGDSFESYSLAGTYVDTLTSYLGCDSIRTLVLNIDALPIPIITQLNDTTLVCSSAASYQWYFNNMLLQDSTNQSLTINQTGTYRVEIFDNNGCFGAVDTMFIMVNTSNIEFKQLKVKVMPNPNKGDFTLECAEIPTGEYQLNIFNITGQLVHSEMLEIRSTNVSIPVQMKDVSDGMYILRLSNSSNIYGSQKLIISDAR